MNAQLRPDPKLGDRREDGRLFRGYGRSRNGNRYERWIDDGYLARQREYHRRKRGEDEQFRNLRRFCGRRSSAKKDGIEFTVTFDQITWPEFCPVFGERIDYGLKGHTGSRRNSPSLDRLDPKKGYVPGNVVVISQRANAAKQNLNSSEMRMLYDWMVRHGL